MPVERTGSPSRVRTQKRGASGDYRENTLPTRSIISWAPLHCLYIENVVSFTRAPAHCPSDGAPILPRTLTHTKIALDTMDECGVPASEPHGSRLNAVRRKHDREVKHHRFYNPRPVPTLLVGTGPRSTTTRFRYQVGLTPTSPNLGAQLHGCSLSRTFLKSRILLNCRICINLTQRNGKKFAVVDKSFEIRISFP